MRLTAGTRVGPYEVVALLGAGGMAEVYRARDTRLGRDVALKVMAKSASVEKALLVRFEQEARLASSLNHPNVVVVFDVGLHEGAPYLVTELLQGETLRERLAEGRLKLETALDWAVQMATGLAAAHARGIVHRDVKPENVFLTRDGHVKLLDFGIAKLVEGTNRPRSHQLLESTVTPSGGVTGTGQVLGTPTYMSPEQVRADAVDARTDLFSFGAVLYEMLSGQRAFPGATAVEAEYAILHAEPEALRPGTPLPLALLVRHLLEKDREKRFQSARDLAFHLELLRAPTGSTRATTAPPAVQVFRGGWRVWALVGTLAALAVSIPATYILGRTRLPTPSAERLTFLRGTVFAGRFSPDGRVVYSAAWGGQQEEIFTSAPGSADTQSLGVPGARLLSVSAHGELAVSLRPVWFGYFSGGGTLALVPSVGGAPREITEHIVFADWSRTGELAVVRYVDGKRQLEYPLGTRLFESSGLIGFPRVSPGGDAVAFWSVPLESAPNELLLVDRKGSIRHLLQSEKSNATRGLAWSPSGDEVWFSEGPAIWAVPLTGTRRLVYRGVSDINLEDISPNGRVLVDIGDLWTELAFVAPGQQRERDLSWPNYDHLVDISDDGRQVLFTAWPNGKAVTYLRPTDGFSPLKLGPGQALALSPDGKSVLVKALENPSALSLLPVGVGAPRKLAIEGLNVGAARWLRDGKRLVVAAQRKGDTQWHLFVVPLEGGTLASLSDEPTGALFLEVSLDDRFAAAIGLHGTVTVYPLDGGNPIPLTAIGKSCMPAGWTSDGQLWLSDRLKVPPNTPSHLLRYDIPSRRVVEERSLVPADLTGALGGGFIRITPDGRSVAFDIVRLLGSLYVLDGLAPPHE